MAMALMKHFGCFSFFVSHLGATKLVNFMQRTDSRELSQDRGCLCVAVTLPAAFAYSHFIFFLFVTLLLSQLACASQLALKSKCLKEVYILQPQVVNDTRPQRSSNARLCSPAAEWRNNINNTNKRPRARARAKSRLAHLTPHNKIKYTPRKPAPILHG